MQLNSSIASKLKIVALIIILLIVLAAAYLYIIIYNKNGFYPTVNRGRILTNSTKTAVEMSITDKDSRTPVKSDFKYVVVDLNGKILLSSINEYKKGSAVSLYDFTEYDSRFSLKNPKLIKYAEPFIINGTQVGTIIFLIPKKDFLVSSPLYATLINLIPIIIAFIVIIMLIIYFCIFAKKNILVPLDDLNKSAKKILKEDFSGKIRYDYDNEVGVFCHNFEAMRDELRYSKEKGIAVRKSEKELLACISHDIKTPLTAINGYVSGIRDGIVKDRQGIENYCNIILKRVRMLSKLLEDILEHSKAELNQLNIKLTEIYSYEFFKNILDDLSIEVENRGLTFIMPPKIPDLVIKIDKKRISQVIYNLVSNSIKYSKEKGTISIYFETDENYLKVYVKDTGIGISSADIPYIFNKFYRGEKSRNQNIPGSGLGLSICKYIIESHGGFIECINSSCKGTTMCFNLPI